MRKLVRLLLIHYDRFGVVALFGWLVCTIALIAIPSVITQQFFIKFVGLNIRLAGFPTTLVISPLVIYLCPTFWAAGLLINERLWMFMGFYKFFVWEPHRLRKMIGKLAHERKSADTK